MHTFDVPTTFDKAWNHPDEFQRHKWRKAVEKELDKMKQMEVWEKVGCVWLFSDPRSQFY